MQQNKPVIDPIACVLWQLQFLNRFYASTRSTNGFFLLAGGGGRFFKLKAATALCVTHITVISMTKKTITNVIM